MAQTSFAVGNVFSFELTSFSGTFQIWNGYYNCETGEIIFGNANTNPAQINSYQGADIATTYRPSKMLSNRVETLFQFPFHSVFIVVLSNMCSSWLWSTNQTIHLYCLMLYESKISLFRSIQNALGPFHLTDPFLWVCCNGTKILWFCSTAILQVSLSLLYTCDQLMISNINISKPIMSKLFNYW